MKKQIIDTEEMTLEMLNECLPQVSIGCYEWGAGDVLLKLDPIAFRQEELAYIDSLLDDGEIEYDEDLEEYVYVRGY